MLITQISGINELRREAIQELEEKIRKTFIRKPRKIVEEKEIISKQSISAPRVSVCLNSMSETLSLIHIYTIIRCINRWIYINNN